MKRIEILTYELFKNFFRMEALTTKIIHVGFRYDMFFFHLDI
jgi:hypothetical protein